MKAQHARIRVATRRQAFQRLLRSRRDGIGRSASKRNFDIALKAEIVDAETEATSRSAATGCGLRCEKRNAGNEPLDLCALDSED